MFSMKRILFAFLISQFAMQISASGQFKGPSPLTSGCPLSKAEVVTSQLRNEPEQSDDVILAARAIAALRRLDDKVLVYRSLGDFEADGRLALVPLEVFKNDLQKVTAEVEPIISQLPQGRLKIEIGNALASYRDGEFRWRQTHHERVVNVSTMAFVEHDLTASDAFFASTIPNTVVIHWRHAATHLKRAKEIINGKKL